MDFYRARHTAFLIARWALGAVFGGSARQVAQQA